MAYKDILVYLDPSSDTDTRLQLAVELALSHGSRLIGMDASSDAAFEGKWREKATGLQDRFETLLNGVGVKGLYRSLDRSRPGGLQHYAHYADLIIASQPEFGARDMVAAGVPEDVLLTAGVPMLLLPCGWKRRPLGQNIVIAWKSGREATRAVHDALPLLLRAKKVTIFTFAPEGDVDGKKPALLVDHLREHEVTAESSVWLDTGGLSPVEALFADLDTEDADLIVAGAYGHARWWESLFGGVSNDLVRQPSLPVLLSH